MTPREIGQAVVDAVYRAVRVHAPGVDQARAEAIAHDAGQHVVDKIQPRASE